MALEAVIFDMDGTLVDSMPYHTRSWQLFFERKGMQVSPEALKEKGHGTLYDILPRFFGNHLTHDEAYELGMEKEALFREIYRPYMEPVSGLVDWLQLLKQQSLKIALGTAADMSNTDFTLDTLDIRKYFDEIVTSDQVKEGKPSPAVYLFAANMLGVDPANCLVFEDTFAGVAAAKSAGMKVAVITTMHPAPEWGERRVDAILNNYYDADLKYLSKLFD